MRKRVVELRDCIGGGWSEGLHGGAFNQPRHLLHESGAKLFYGSPREDQPLVLEVAGEVCETHAGDFVRHGVELGGRCTRFDVAADVGPDELTMRRWRELRRDFRAGRCQTRLPRTSCDWRQGDRPGQGVTAYYGSVSSEMMLRVYTRRGPLRMEFEIKPSRPAAREAWAGQLNTYSAGEVWRYFGRKVEWPAAWYRRVLEGTAATMKQVTDEARSFDSMMEYLREQVGPTAWLLRHLGVRLEDIEREPPNPSGQWVADTKRIAVEASRRGFNGDQLRRAADQVAARRRIGDGRARDGAH